ncbi:hypothetical protein AAFF27_18680 [Xylophilus sp. GW821-FHT01B05]
MKASQDSSPTAAQKLVTWGAGVAIDVIPAEGRERVKLHILD